MKTTPHTRKRTPLWYRVKLLYQQTKKAQSERSTEYQKEKRSHKETGVPASNKQEHHAQKLQS